MKKLLIFTKLLTFIFILNECVTVCNCENDKKSVEDNREDNGDGGNEESLDIVPESEVNNISCTRRESSQVHEIMEARPKQFPFMAAIMSQQNEFLCSGVVVSNGLILTTASCTQQPISYVLLSTTHDKQDDSNIMLHVIKSEKFPTFSDGDSRKDAGLIYTEKHNSSIATKIKLSNFTSANTVSDIEAFGFGLNTEVGQSKPLQYVGLENRILYEPTDELRGFIDCIDTKVLTCFKDQGGPVIFDNELLGIVVRGQDECSKELTSMYYSNKRMIDILPTFLFKPWLEEKISKNEESDAEALVFYPTAPVQRAQLVQETSESKPYGDRGVESSPTSILILCSCISYFMIG